MCGNASCFQVSNVGEFGGGHTFIVIGNAAIQLLTQAFMDDGGNTGQVKKSWNYFTTHSLDLVMRSG